jgi:hypothetical protein
MNNNKCFEHNHMTMRQFGLWNRVRGLQRKWGFVYFDGDDLANGFRFTSRDAVFDDCNVLLKLGFFELQSPRKRKKDGTYESRKIAAITHKEWAKKYPNKCLKPETSQSPIATGKKPIQSPNATSQSPIAIDQSPNATSQSLQSDKDLFKAGLFKTDMFRAVPPPLSHGHIDPHESAPEGCAASGVVHGTERIELTPRQVLEAELARARKTLSGWQKNNSPEVQVYVVKSQQRVADLEQKLVAMESNSPVASAESGSNVQ